MNKLWSRDDLNIYFDYKINQTNKSNQSKTNIITRPTNSNIIVIIRPHYDDSFTNFVILFFVFVIADVVLSILDKKVDYIITQLIYILILLFYAIIYAQTNIFDTCYLHINLI